MTELIELTAGMEEEEERRVVELQSRSKESQGSGNRKKEVSGASR